MMMHSAARMRAPGEWRPGARAMLLVGFGALAAVMAFGAYEFFASYPKDARIDAGPVSRFPAHTVTYVPAARALVVHEGGDGYVALFEQSPWLQQVHPTGYEQCHVHWYAIPPGKPIPFVSGGSMGDVAWDGYARATAGDRGVFVENCSGWAFDVYGNHVFGGSGPLDRHPVQIAGGRVIIDTGMRERTKKAWPAVAPP
jgi:hypothetical protein